MGDQTEVIRQQMEGTRTALAEKLGQLEAQVTDKVQQATTTVAETVDNVSEAVDSVKETVDGTVEAVKHTFDLEWHAKHHPWLLLGGAVVLGFVGGRMLAGPGRPRERHHRAYGPPPPPPPPPKPAPQKKSEEESGGVLGWVGNAADGLKKVGIGMAMGVLREVVTGALPAQIGPPLSSVMNGLTEKLGGEPLGVGQDHAPADDPPRKDQGGSGPYI
jgi:hypothetical protein